MTDLVAKTLRGLDEQLPGQVSTPGGYRYPKATAIWPKRVGNMPRAVVHCFTPQDVQLSIRAARDCYLPLSVRCGGHDWKRRALFVGLVRGLRGMNSVR